MTYKPYILAVIVGLIAIQAYVAMGSSDFARYEVILKRRPFGAPPAGSKVRPPPPPPPDDALKNYRMVGITRGDDGAISVGIVDIGSNPPKSYFLSLGDSGREIMLVDADFELEGALIRKGNDEKWLYLGGSKGVGGGSSSSASASGNPDSSAATAKGVQSYIDRMRARRAERYAPKMHSTLKPAELSAEDLRARLQKYNMELIRAAAKGESKGPPLPIPLTPEQDKQLVEEGVLPPQQ